MTLWLASTNPGKLREFAEAASARGIAVQAVPGLERVPPCVEDGDTFEANARKKAAYYSRLWEGLVFADDSGICVDALGGGPGVHSARFAGPEATDEENNARLMADLRRALVLPGPSEEAGGAPANPDFGGAGPRSAHYVCVIALARQGEILVVTRGEAHGVVNAQPRGSGGFGYDPYFFYPPLGRTFAELSPEEKFAVSHRGEAFRKLLDALQSPENRIANSDAPAREQRTPTPSVIS